MPLTKSDIANIVRWATDNAQDMSLAEIGEKFNVSWQVVLVTLANEGITKPRKLGAEYKCQADGCPRRFRGTKAYSGHKARYCHEHRRKRGE